MVSPKLSRRADVTAPARLQFHARRPTAPRDTPVPLWHPLPPSPRAPRMHATRFASAFVMLAALAGAGCRRKPAAAAPTPAPLDEEYCWWAVLRTTLPPDTVAARFERAFAAVGLTGGGWTRQGDTAWAHAGPTAGQPGAPYASRAVAYRRGDSTHFRYYVGIAAARLAPPDSAPTLIPLCGRIARAAAVPTSTPASPTGEESLPVWRRRP